MTPEQLSFLMQIIVCMVVGWAIMYGMIWLAFKGRDLFTGQAKVAKREKEIRIKYQNIVYGLCNTMEEHLHYDTRAGNSIQVSELEQLVNRELKEYRKLLAENIGATTVPTGSKK